MKSKDWSGFEYSCPDFSSWMPGRRIESFEALQPSSEMRLAGIIYQGTQSPVSGFIERRFKVLKLTSFATKESKCLSGRF